MRLLVVEDEKDLNSIIVKNLQAERLHRRFLFDGADAISFI